MPVIVNNQSDWRTQRILQAVLSRKVTIYRSGYENSLPLSGGIVYNQLQTGIHIVCLRLQVHLGAWCRMTAVAWGGLREEDHPSMTNRCSFIK